jgi:DSF synthase
MQAVFSCRRNFHPVTYDEMLNIANVWVDAALRLEEKDLKMMSRLVRSQSRRVQGGIDAQTSDVRSEMTTGLRFAFA